MASIPGLELLFNSFKSTFKSPEDVIVSAIHWLLISNEFKVIGIGDEAPHDEAEKKSEMLPPGWNDAEDLYILRYKPTSGDQTHLLKIMKVGGALLVHVMRVPDEKLASMTIRVSDYVTGNMSSFDSEFQNLDELQHRFKKEIITELSTTSNTTTETRSSDHDQSLDVDPLRVGPPRPGQANPHPQWADPDDPFAVGRGDLDPFGGGVGGMMMDPMRGRGSRFVPDPNAGLPRRLPRGAVPPGARFDPFGPGGGGGGAGPDPDHLPPPGYNDMFM